MPLPARHDPPTATHELVLRCTIPGEPAPKQRPVTLNRAGRVWTFTPKETVEAERRILQTAADWMRSLDDPTGQYAVTLRFFSERPSGRKRTCDLDNYVKLVLDALTPQRAGKGKRPRGPGLIWRDDRQVIQLHASRFDRQENPRTEMAVYRLQS